MLPASAFSALFLAALCRSGGLIIPAFPTAPPRLSATVPKHWFRADRFPFRTKPWEEKLYRALRVRQWQNRVPDMSRIFPRLMPPKRMTAHPDAQTLLVMIRETCVAELTHWLLLFAGLAIPAIWPGAWGIAACVVYCVFGNLIFILIQRYNRPRLVRLYARRNKKRSTST